MEYYCTEQEWYKANITAIDWYKTHYPVLENFNLPLPHQFLREFYIKDYEDRNLPVDYNLADCYDFVFSYFLENYEKPLDKKFQGKTWLGYLASNFPGALRKTFSDINNDIFKPVGNLFNIFTNPLIIFIILIIILLFIWRK